MGCCESCACGFDVGLKIVVDFFFVFRFGCQEHGPGQPSLNSEAAFAPEGSHDN